MPINELRSIATFIKAAELGSLRQAAVAQGMTPQAASQALAQLEQHLGVRLFHRTTRNMALTDEGRQFLEAAQPSLVGLQRAVQTAKRAKDGIAGPLRIVGPRSIFMPVLWSLLEEYCALYPEVQPDIELDDRIGNWVADRVDVGFRIGRSAEDGVVARRLFTLQLIVCASPEYIARHGAPENREQLSEHRCSAYRSPSTGKILSWYLKDGDGVLLHDVVPALCSNDEELEIKAVLAGQVIGLLSGIAVAGHIRAGRLVPLLTTMVTDHLGIYVYYGSRASQPARVRMFIDLAIQRLTDSPAYCLTAKELASTEAKGRKAHKRR